MKDCKKTKKDLVAFLAGELEEKERLLVRRHLETCSSCERELQGLRRTVAGTEAVIPEIEEAVSSVDWDSLPERIVESILERESRKRQIPWRERFRFSLPHLKPVLAGLLVGLIIGGLAAYFIFRGQLPGRPEAEGFFASSEFLDRVDLELARRETLDYLDKSQAVLLEVLQSPAEEGGYKAGGPASERAKELLSRKRYLDSQLEKVQMAKAREICDQIEFLFLELAQVSEDLTEAQRREIMSLIEERKLLLKIRLLKKELQESEV